MPLQSVWAWTFLVSANSQFVSGSMDVSIPSQAFAYISTGIQRFRLFQDDPVCTGTIEDASPLIASYTVTGGGAPRPAGSTVVFDNNIDSVNFTWTLDASDCATQVSAQYLFQIFGWD